MWMKERASAGRRSMRATRSSPARLRTLDLAVGDHVGRTRLRIEHAQLPDHLAGIQGRDDLILAPDQQMARDHHEEGVALLRFAKEHLAVDEALGRRQPGHQGELGLRQGLEELQAAQKARTAGDLGTGELGQGREIQGQGHPHRTRRIEDTARAKRGAIYRPSRRVQIAVFFRQVLKVSPPLFVDCRRVFEKTGVELFYERQIRSTQKGARSVHGGSDSSVVCSCRPRTTASEARAGPILP